MIHKQLLNNMPLYYNYYDKRTSDNLLLLAIQLFIYILEKIGKNKEGERKQKHRS